MSRVKLVTRTVTTTICDVMTVDVTTAKVSNVEVELTGTFVGTEDALKTIKKLYETDVVKYVAINSMVTDEALYGMTEEQFISCATKLPPRKVYGADEIE